MAVVLSDLEGESGHDRRQSDKANAKIREVCDMLRANMERLPSLETLAAAVGLSQRQLARAFRNTTGRTVVEWIATRRLEKAERMLQEDVLSIKEISWNTSMPITNDVLRTSHILIVDDEPANVAVLEALLHGEGCTNLMSTGDPRDVVGLHQIHDFDIILLDIRMPQMSGIEVMEELAATLEEGDWLPVLVLTAQTDDETRFQALTAGARDFVNKPFKRWEVLLRIRNMLETRRLYKRQRLRADELEEIVQERTKEVRETQLQIIERLGQAGEYRDEETGMHVMRMSHSCQMLALAAGLGAARAELILYATPMHDVGKIGIPDNILLKPGRHDPKERKIMETHVSIGAKIIGEHKSELLMMARNVALCHHEKWDGSGYPQGLKGEDIPIEARIAAICDVFDALTSSRPYKEAWPLEKAVALVKDQSGKHFDPRLVEVFLGILPEIVALREQFHEG